VTGGDADALLAAALGDDNLERARGAVPTDAVQLVTANREGWPHVAWLSVGEVVRLGTDRLAFCLWDHSSTAENLRSGNRALLHAVAGGQVLRCRLIVWPLGPLDVDQRRLAGFVAEVAEIRADAVAYADVVSGPRYRLHPPTDEVVDRWHRQRTMLAHLAARRRRPDGSGRK
jgi:hypothetical protein